MICLKNRTFAVSQTTRPRLVCAQSRLWFAWKIVLLQYRKQHWSNNVLWTLGCDLLEKSYFCSIANNKSIQIDTTEDVVICLKNRTFAVSQTTIQTYKYSQNVLWFAWKIVLLQYRKQHKSSAVNSFKRCDLLEKSYFCSIANNTFEKYSRCEEVVICLKNRTFAVSQTTKMKKFIVNWSCDLLEKSYFCSIANNGRAMQSWMRWLWFAWKIVLLQYRKQQGRETNGGLCVVICLKNRTFAVSQTTSTSRPACKTCCDLLEKSYFCSIANNSDSENLLNKAVVICLKNRTFAVSQTTWPSALLSLHQLWFAWKIVLLQYRKQLSVPRSSIITGCDLLEKSYFCSIANNNILTTSTLLGLWFAWKIVLLQYRKQLIQQKTEHYHRCDLLEKSYFCSIANNNIRKSTKPRLVVICLKNRTFAVSQTTSDSSNTKRTGCDLLEKSYFCSIANNEKTCLYQC